MEIVLLIRQYFILEWLHGAIRLDRDLAKFDRFATHANNAKPDSFTVSLHSTNGRQIASRYGCVRRLSVAFENGGNSYRSREPIMHRMWGIPQSKFGPANHTDSNRANCQPCLIPHQQSYCHHTRPVKQSNTYRKHDINIAWKRRCLT